MKDSSLYTNKAHKYHMSLKVRTVSLEMGTNLQYDLVCVQNARASVQHWKLFVRHGLPCRTIGNLLLCELILATRSNAFNISKANVAVRLQFFRLKNAMCDALFTTVRGCCFAATSNYLYVV